MPQPSLSGDDSSRAEHSLERKREDQRSVCEPPSAGAGADEVPSRTNSVIIGD